MGNYRVIINAVGGHGQDREKGHGEQVDFGENTPEAIVKDAVEKLRARGESVTEATVHHWPGSTTEVVDNLLTGKRTGSFRG